MTARDYNLEAVTIKVKAVLGMLRQSGDKKSGKN